MTEPRPTNRWLVLAVVAAVIQIVVIDITVVYVAAPSISEDLRPSAVSLLWIVDIYSLVVAPLLVLAATLADRFGRKRVLLIGLTLFTAASVFAAAAWSPGALILARALQGIGGATVLPSTMAIIRDVFPDRDERVKAIGVWSATMSAGAAGGPVIGGLLTEHFSWNAVFLINVPVFLVVMPLAIRLIPESRNRNPPRWDPASVLMSGVGVLLLAYGIKDGARHGLGVVPVACLVASVGLLTWFTRRQLGRENPTIDLRLFASTPFRVAVICLVLSMFALVGMDLFFAQYFQLVLGLGPAAASYRLVPLLLASVAGSLVAGWLITRFGTRLVMSLSLALAAASLVPMLWAGQADQYLLFLPSFLVLGMTIDLVLVTANDAIFSSVSADGAGQASAIEETAYDLGGGMAIAVLGSVLASIYTARVEPPPGLTAAASGSVRESLSEAVLVADDLGPTATLVLHRARDAFLAGFHTVTLVAIAAVTLAALIAAVTLKGGRGGDGLVGDEDGAAARDGAGAGDGAARLQGTEPRRGEGRSGGEGRAARN